MFFGTFVIFNNRLNGSIEPATVPESKIIYAIFRKFIKNKIILSIKIWFLWLLKKSTFKKFWKLMIFHQNLFVGLFERIERFCMNSLQLFKTSSALWTFWMFRKHRSKLNFRKIFRNYFNINLWPLYQRESKVWTEELGRKFFHDELGRTCDSQLLHGWNHEPVVRDPKFSVQIVVRIFLQ